ncbi:MAG: hypothetical protein BGN86_13500 [Caulobacterales bacterium 68-7]|nr:MAG: hypothetical protein BGN86_13500 [Caulobacterales bacterium 68-7]
MFREKNRQLQEYLSTRPRLRRFAKIAPFFAIGPISGPLLAGVIFNFKDGRPVLGVLYAVALAEYTYLLPATVAKLSMNLVS